MLLKCNFNIPISVHVFYLLAMGCFLEYLGRVARHGTWHCKWKTLGQVSQQSSSPPLRHTAHQSSFELFSSIPLSPLVASSCCCYRLDVQISQVVHDIKKRSENLWYSHDGWLLSLNKQSIISKMIFNKVNHHKLIGHFFLVSGYIFKCRLTWLVSALFQRVCFCVPSSGLCLQAARTAGFWVSSILGLFYQWLSVFPHPTLPLSFLHWFIQCWRVPGMGAHGWVAGICQPWEWYSI